MTPEKEQIIPKNEAAPETTEESELESKKATTGQLKFYEGEIVTIKNIIEGRKSKGLDTKELEERLKKIEKLKEEGQK